eukprot:7203865-Lingulodinium_polyedra.AAC.1
MKRTTWQSRQILLSHTRGPPATPNANNDRNADGGAGCKTRTPLGDTGKTVWGLLLETTLNGNRP